MIILRQYKLITVLKMDKCYKNLIFILHLIKMLNKVNYGGKIKTDTKIFCEEYFRRRI